MKLHIHGAAGEVTGALYLLEADNKKILIDCGMIQGSFKDEKRNELPFPFRVTDIDAVILSHAHIDHSGRLPLLAKRGYKGPIYTQSASRDLCTIMLKDAGFINEKDVAWLNKKRARKGLKPIEPLYTVDDADAVMSQFVVVEYDQPFNLSENISVRLLDAGHILGSAIVEISVKQNNNRLRKIVYSGDLGVRGAPILRDPTYIQDADWVIMECTYGNRLHRTMDETLREIQDVFTNNGSQKGNIIIPAFAVGRTQDLLYLFTRYYHEWKLDQWQIFLDSPMAIDATHIYEKHIELYDQESTKLLGGGTTRSHLPNLRLVKSAEESMSLNQIVSGAVIIAGSGMCTGGRVRHHLKHHLWHKNCHIVVVGFQAQGTTGRALVDGAKYVRLFGETIRVAAKIHTIGGLSAHADQNGLVDWIRHFRNRPPVILVHGERNTRTVFAEVLKEKFGCRVIEPELMQVIELN